jgi:glycosyltransferase involved in cell wall biosynthesis
MNNHKCDITVLIPTLNEELNLPHCLKPLLGWVKKIIIVDSSSTDNTIRIAENAGVEIVSFNYRGGWPKKRQFVLETYQFNTDWVLLLDADEILLDDTKKEIEEALKMPYIDGYYLWFRLEFMGKMLLRSDPGFRKLSLFRVGKGNFEKRLIEQDNSMGDMEVHEHVIVNGKVSELRSPVLHRNFNNLSRFIIKHDEYSNYECKVHTQGLATDLKARFWGKTEERRRYIKKKFIRNPIAPIFYFFYLYILKGGILEGYPGFYYILYQCIYLYFVNSKIYEIEHVKNPLLLTKDNLN